MVNPDNLTDQANDFYEENKDDVNPEDIANMALD